MLLSKLPAPGEIFKKLAPPIATWTLDIKNKTNDKSIFKIHRRIH